MADGSMDGAEQESESKCGGDGSEASPKFTALRLLLALTVGAVLYFAHVAFVPLALAALIALVLSGPVEALHSLGLPRSAAAALIMLLIGGIAAGVADFLWDPAQHWFAEAPHTVRVLGKKIQPVASFMDRIDRLKDSAANLTTSTSHSAPPPSKPAGPSAPMLLFDVTLGVVVSTITILILTLFLLSGGPPMLARMSAALASDLNSGHVLGVIEKVRREVGRFYVTTALINVGLGLATGCVMLGCGMPNPFLWGTVAGVLNFIPYVGPSVTFLLLMSVAIVSFDGLAHVAAVAGCYLGLVAVEGHLVQPLLVGRRLQLNPLLVFLALWFGGMFWGIAGVVLATPTLVALKVIAKNSERGQPLVEFLSPQSAPDEAVYTRRTELRAPALE